MTNLKDKAIDIKGKKYVLVSDRVLAFNEEFKNGCIQTEMIEWLEEKSSNTMKETVVVKAKVIPDTDKTDRYFTGYAQEVIGQGYINKTSALENAETSAVGRALALMGIGVLDSIASVDEINKAKNRGVKTNPTPDTPNGEPFN